MSTTAASNPTHDPSSDHFDPDEVLPKNSPLLAPHRPRLRSPSPPFALPRNKVSSPSSPGTRRSNHRRMKKVRPSQGDALLVGLLGGGRQPEIAIRAGNEVLPSGSDSEYEETSSSSSVSPQREAHLDHLASAKEARRRGDGEGEGYRTSPDLAGPPSKTGMADLTTLAAGALAKIGTEARSEPVDAGPTPPVTEHDVVLREREVRSHGHIPPPIPTILDGPLHDERSIQSGGPPPYSPASYYSPRDPNHSHIPRMDMHSPSRLPQTNHKEGLPPIHMASPRSESNGQTLPPIRVQLGDLKTLSLEKDRAQMEQDRARRHNTFAHSPPGTLPRLPSMHNHHGSPPVSPVDTFRRELPSPGYSIASTTSPGYPYPTNNMHRIPDYTSSSTETPGSTDQSASTPGAVSDRMSIDGLTNPPGYYMCSFPGCNAPPFQTQYLLNSHANVHSSIRPHYCPVKGCPRGEGGRGFKRKNEMIRHGLVHDSPGYVCPFCPDREHKYPRPDNLQRHVRVHHMDKNKDDPTLRDVLSQRPDGPNRGRRRRNGPS